MTNNERVKLLRKLNPNHILIPDYSVREIEEVLNWAIKICEKYESRRRAKERQFYD